MGVGVGDGDPGFTVTTKLVLVLCGPSFTVTVIVAVPVCPIRRCHCDRAIGAAAPKHNIPVGYQRRIGRRRAQLQIRCRGLRVSYREIEWTGGSILKNGLIGDIRNCRRRVRPAIRIEPHFPHRRQPGRIGHRQ